MGKVTSRSSYHQEGLPGEQPVHPDKDARSREKKQAPIDKTLVLWSRTGTHSFY
jgi:hypothetical protein